METPLTAVPSHDWMFDPPFYEQLFGASNASVVALHRDRRIVYADARQPLHSPAPAEPVARPPSPDPSAVETSFKVTAGTSAAKR